MAANAVSEATTLTPEQIKPVPDSPQIWLQYPPGSLVLGERTLILVDYND